MSSGPTPPSLRAALFVVAVITAMALAFTGSYAGALHEPTPHGIPIAVSPGIPSAVTKGGIPAFEFRRFSSNAATLASIDRRETYGALLRSGSGVELVTAPAASLPISTIVTAELGGGLRSAGVPVRASVVHPLASGDRSGVLVFYVIAGWVIAGYMGAIMLGAVFGPLPPRTQMTGRMFTLTILAIVAGFSCAGLGYAIGDLPGSLLLAGLLGVLTVLAVGTAATALQAMFGPVATYLTVLIIVVIGYPASGGPLASELLPGFWRATGPFIPVGAGTTALRNVVYFPDASVLWPVVILVVWLICGAAVALLRAGQPDAAAPTMTEAEAAAAAAAAP